MLNTVHLLTFLTVVELGTYSAAAERLHLSQPAVSQHIDALEEQLGNLRLFRRVAQRMVLTHAGEELLPAARSILAMTEQTQNSLLALQGQVSGQLRIAFASDSAAWLLPIILHNFHQLYPYVRIQLEMVAYANVFSHLERQQVDAIWHDESQRRRGWDSITLGQEAVTCCVSSRHEWCQLNLVTLGMVRDQPLILPSVGSLLRRQIDEQLRRAGIIATDLTILLETNSVMATLSAIQQHMAIGFVPVVCQSLPHIQSIPLRGLNLQLDWFVLMQKESTQNPAMQALRSFLSSDAVARLLRDHSVNPHTAI